MMPVLGRIGPLLIYSYTAVLGVGVLLCVGLAVRRLPGRAALLTHLLLTGGAALLGGRTAFVLANSGYYTQRPFKIFELWQGGLGYHGALLAGLLFFWLRPVAQRRLLADAVAPGLLLLSATGWLACYLEGCAFGAAALVGPLTADLPDTFGVFDVRYRTQQAGLLLTLSAAAGLLRLQQRRGWRAGGRWFWAALALTGGSHALASLLRGDPMPLLGPLRLDVALDLLLLSVALLLLVRSRATRR